jgi:hypothetical protein
MRILFKGKDGGPESNVTGYWLFESKRFGSVVLLRFDEGSREAYHSHAFNAISWVLKGWLIEEVKTTTILGITLNSIQPSFKPIHTARDRMHKVYGMAKRTWVLSFRGPWVKTWKEWLPKEGREVTLTNGRKEVVE